MKSTRVLSATLGTALVIATLGAVSQAAAVDDPNPPVPDSRSGNSLHQPHPHLPSRGLLDPAGFGGLLWFGGGIGSGDDVSPADSVYGPKGLVGIRFELAYSFVYLGTGLTGLYFEDQAPLRQEVVYSTTGGDAGTKTSSAEAFAFDVELGAAHSFVFAERGWGIRPSLGLGLQSSPEVDRYIQDCQGCDSEVVLKDYVGGPFARAQLGVYKRFPFALGLTFMVQQFLGEVTGPALERAFMAGLVYGVDGQ
jgi:hypothetical protein